MNDSTTESEPTDNIWDGDLLGRKEEAVYLQRYIENLYKLDKKDQTSFVLNINSEWGHGKTWFLIRLKKELSKNHPVVYFDAWKNDFSKDALLSFVSIVCDELSKQFVDQPKINSKVQAVKRAFSKWGKKAVPIVAAATVKQLTGIALDKFNDGSDADLSNNDFASIAEELTKIASSCAIEEFSKKKDAIKLFEQSIGALVAEIHGSGDLYLPICIFIDELDRCRPTYAIELLEAVKHLFSIKGIFFILATDTRQLSHSIKVVYGQNFDAAAYLKRFFYTEYNLSYPNYKNIGNYLFAQANLSSRLYLSSDLIQKYRCAGVFALVSEYFMLTVRDQEQVYAMLESALLATNRDNLHLIWLLYLICMKHKYEEKYLYLKGGIDGVEVNKIHVMETKAVYLTLPTVNGGIQREHIDNLFMFYNNLRDRQLKEPSFRFSVESNLYFQLETAQHLDHHLNDYFSIIDHAGFFKIS